MSKTTIHFEGNDFMLHRDELDDALLEDLLNCGGSGDQLDNVQYVMEQHAISGDPEACRLYLRNYGAWDDAELQDHTSNLERLVWITGCDLSENDEAYFSTY
jgi:hypothetical protein